MFAFLGLIGSPQIAAASGSGPVAAYSFDEGEGETVEDLTGNGHTGTIHGAKWTTRGRYGDALEYYAPEEDYVSIPASEDLDGSEELTVEAWVRPTITDPYYGEIVMKEREGSPAYSWTLDRHETEAAGFFMRTEEGMVAGGEGSLPLHTWTHVAMTNDGAHNRLYVNGELVDTEPAIPFDGHGEIRIGGNSIFGQYFYGRIDELRIYDRALDGGEIGVDKDAPLQTPSQGPVAAYSFDEGEGSTVEDHTGNGHTGTIEGAEWAGGKYGGSLKFDGEDMVTIPASEDLNLTEEFTLEAWIKPETEGEYGHLFVKEDAAEEQTAYVITKHGSKLAAYLGVPGVEEESPSSALEVGAWQHVAVTYDGARGRLYVNNELVGDALVAEVLSTDGALRIGGGDLWWSDEGFKGRIDEVRIYDRALDGEEVGADMETGVETSASGPMPTDEPEIEGLPEVTRSLIATDGTWISDEPPTFTYQWQRCATYTSGCADIVGATSKSYELSTEDLSEHIRVIVYALNSLGKGEAVSQATAEVSPSPPWLAVDPTITGNPEDGIELAVDLDGLRGSTPQELAYEWQRCDLSCEVIEGATGSSYTTTKADVAQMLRVKITAKNASGEISKWTAPTGFITSTATKGPPVLSQPPLIGGLPRATDSMATAATWAGEKPISTEVQWQRCNMAGELCEDITGATDPIYEPTEADQYSRLRTKISASNKEGTASAFSAASQYIHPANNTTFTLDPPVPLGDVETAIEESGAKWLSFGFGGETSGLSTVPAGTTNIVEEISTIRGEDASELPVVSFELADSVPAEALSSLSENLSSREVGPSLRPSSDSSVAEKREEEESPHQAFSRGAVEEAKLAGIANTDKTTNSDFPGQLDIKPGMDRLMYSKFWWHPSLEETLLDIFEVGSPLAMEFDVRQINHDNTDMAIDLPGPLPPFQVTCRPWEENNFWIGTREPTLIETTAPVDAGLYWDTGAEDPCTVKDLTYGFYHPEALESSFATETLVYFDGGDADGDVDASPLSWQIEILGEHCDHSPWCVNIPLEDIDGVATPIITDGAPYYPRFAAPPVLPYCYRYSNPLYEVEYPDLPGTSPCLFAS
jgi:hypothetical protein